MASSGAAPAGSVENQAAALVSATTKQDTFVAPVYADLQLDGSANLTTLNLVSVSMAYNDRFDIMLDAADTLKLLNSFVVSGAGATFKVDWAEGELDKFQSILAKVLANATCTSSGTVESVGKKLADILHDEGLSAFRNAFADMIPNILESGWFFSTSVNYAGGAENMYNALDAAAREIIAQQIPQSKYAMYMDGSENPTITTLPVTVGDKLVFVFTANQVLIARGAKKTPGTSGDVVDTAVTVDSANAYGISGQNITYDYNTRKIAFFVALSGAEGEATGSKIAALED